MKKILTVSLVGFFPLLALAETQTVGLTDLITKFTTYLNMALPILISIAVIWFVWQVIMFTISNDEDKRKEAKSGIVWGVIGLFVIICMWGLVKFVETTLGIDEGTQVVLPQFPTTDDNTGE